VAQPIAFDPGQDLVDLFFMLAHFESELVMLLRLVKLGSCVKQVTAANMDLQALTMSLFELVVEIKQLLLVFHLCSEQ